MCRWRLHSIWAWMLVSMVALAPVVARASVVTFHQNKQLDGNSAGATLGGGSGFATASDWTAITFLDGTDCASVLGAGNNCGNNSVLLVVDSNVVATPGNFFGIGGVAFNYSTSPTPTIGFNGDCTGCTGPNGTTGQGSNTQALPNAAVSGPLTTGYDVSISWSNSGGDANQTFAGPGRTSILMTAGGLSAASFTATNAAGKYAVASIVKCTTNCGAIGTVVASAFDVPEPASLALLGVGLTGLGWAVRRRRG